MAAHASEPAERATADEPHGDATASEAQEVSIADQRRLLEGARFLYERSLAGPVDTGSELAFVSRCVATILRAHHRADPGTPAELATWGGLRLTHEEGEWVFAADRARFRFRMGEFPAYDLVRARIAAEGRGEEILPLTPGEAVLCDALYQEAIALLDAAQSGSR